MLILWSHPTWNLFHVLPANMIEELFDEIFKIECIELFTKICCAIPCGMCRHHACDKMKTLIKDEIKTARDLELFFWNFHNEVNERTKNDLFPEEKLIKYKTKNVKKIMKEFKYILESYYRNDELLKEYKEFTSKYQDKFSLYEKPKKDKKDKDKKDKDKKDKDKKDKDKKDKDKKKDKKDKDKKKDKKDKDKKSK